MSTYSGGMRRRLNLGCALVSGPRLVLLDEPTVAVDPQSRAHIFDAVRALRARGTTILYTTHYLEEAEDLCDRIAIMDEGRVVACGTLPELLALSHATEVIELRLLHPPETVAPLEAVDGVRKVEAVGNEVRIFTTPRAAGAAARLPRRLAPWGRASSARASRRSRSTTCSSSSPARSCATDARGAPPRCSRRRSRSSPPGPAAESRRRPLALTRSVLERSNAIVRGRGDRKQKLAALSDLLRGFLDTDALARLAAGTAPRGPQRRREDEFLRLFHEFFVRTYVQRLLLFDAPDFAYGGEKVNGDDARVATEVVTPGDRFAVDYTLHRNPEGWRATDIVVEGVSLAKNFRAQFDAAVAKDSFQGLLERLRAKVAAPAEGLTPCSPSSARTCASSSATGRALVFSLLMPILVITVIAEGLFHGDDGPKLMVPVVNEDGGPGREHVPQAPRRARRRPRR